MDTVKYHAEQLYYFKASSCWATHISFSVVDHKNTKNHSLSDESFVGTIKSVNGVSAKENNASL